VRCFPERSTRNEGRLQPSSPMEASRFSQAFSSFWKPYRAYQLVLDGQQRLQRLYYALKHNRSGGNDAPLLISFEAELADLIVDGSDFLFTLFQFGDPLKARPLAQRLFGSAVLRLCRSRLANR
jgi:hypothetical protein